MPGCLSLPIHATHIGSLVPAVGKECTAFRLRIPRHTDLHDVLRYLHKTQDIDVIGAYRVNTPPWAVVNTPPWAVILVGDNGGSAQRVKSLSGHLVPDGTSLRIDPDTPYESVVCEELNKTVSLTLPNTMPHCPTPNSDCTGWVTVGQMPVCPFGSDNAVKYAVALLRHCGFQPVQCRADRRTPYMVWLRLPSADEAVRAVTELDKKVRLWIVPGGAFMVRDTAKSPAGACPTCQERNPRSRCTMGEACHRMALFTWSVRQLCPELWRGRQQPIHAITVDLSKPPQQKRSRHQRVESSSASE
jgi:hypothetical protein